MPRIKPAPPNRRRAFRKTLPPGDQEKFDHLAELIDDPRQTLDWYHEIGGLTRDLRPPRETGDYRGSGWFVRLAEALGPGRWFFHKAVRFVELYPTEKALRELKALGVDWSRVWLSFSIHDTKKRHALLKKAVKQRWTILRFRLAMQEKFRPALRGIGGRLRKPAGRWGPEVCLREMNRLIEALLDFHGGAWKKVTPGEWKQFANDFAAAERERLQDLLRKTGAALKKLAAGGDQMRKKPRWLHARI